MSIHILIQMIKSAKRKLYIVVAFVVTLFLVACINQSLTSTEAANTVSKTSTNSAIQVDGRITPDAILNVEERVESNNDAVLLTLAGAVSPQGDRTVQVVNRLEQNGEERSTVTVLDANGNQLVNRELQWLVGPVNVSPDGSQIITSGSDRTTRIWDAQLKQLASFDGHQASVQSLQVSPNGNYILTIEYPDLIPPGQPLNQVVIARLLDLQATQLAAFQGLPIGAHPYKYMQFSPNSQQLLAVINGVVQVIDLQGNPQLTFNQNQQEFAIAQFSPDGRAVLAAGSETMKLWDLQGQLQAEFSHWTVNPEERIASIQLGNNGQVVTGSSTGILRFWDAQSNQVVTVKAHEGEIHAIAISPDGTQIATLGKKTANAVEDNHIRVWNRQGQLLNVLGINLPASFFEGVLNQLSASYSLQFTADGKQIIATEIDQIGTTIQWTL